MSPVRPEHTAGRDLPEHRRAAGLPVLIRPVVEEFIPELDPGAQSIDFWDTKDTLEDFHVLGPNVVKLGEQERGDTKWLNAAVGTPRWTGLPQVAERNGDHGKHQVVTQVDETAAARTVRIGVPHRAAIGFAFEDHPPGRGEGRIADLPAQAPQAKGSPAPAEIGAKSFLEYRTKRHAHEGVGGVAVEVAGKVEVAVAVEVKVAVAVAVEVEVAVGVAVEGAGTVAVEGEVTVAGEGAGAGE